MVAWMIDPTMPPPIDTPTAGSTRPADEGADDADDNIADQPKP